MKYPSCGQIYTLTEILRDLKLRDSPCLLFKHEGVVYPIQDSHLTDSAMLDVLGLAETKWTYIHETDEWIPVFNYVVDRPITDFVEFKEEDGETVAYPKGTDY